MASKHWVQPKGDDAALLAAIAQVNEPLEILECLLANSMFVGPDPYYRDINDALWHAAERVVAAGATE